MLRAVGAAALVASARGHGALVSPRSRNAIDINVGVNCVGYECDAKATAIVGSEIGVYGGCVNATHPGKPCVNGQAAFWYSQVHLLSFSAFACFCSLASARRLIYYGSIRGVLPPLSGAASTCSNVTLWGSRFHRAASLGAMSVTTGAGGGRPTCATRARSPRFQTMLGA